METATKSDVREILSKLSKLQEDIDTVTEYIEDSSLSSQDLKDLDEYKMEKKKGKLISEEEMVGELEL